MTAPDPFETLGVSPAATDVELRAAYRRLVQQHHPDHNHGSPESARRFTEIQEAYAQIKLRRAQQASAAAPGATSAADPEVEQRLAAMERELRQARERRERAARTAREAEPRARAQHEAPRTAAAGGSRPSAEELGYVTTNDSFGKIFDDLADEVAMRLHETDPGHASGDRRAERTGRRPRGLADWIDELGSRLTGEK